MLTSNIESKRKKDFVKRISREFKNTDTSLVLGSLKDITIIFDKDTKVYCGKKDIVSFDLVVFRGVSANERSIASAVAIILKSKRIKFIDTIYSNIGTSENKLVSFAKLFSDGFSLPTTCYTSGELSKARYDLISKELGLPFVAKDLIVQRGLGVSLINGYNEFSKLGKPHIFQKLIDKDHEYRVLVLGNSIGIFEEKIAGNPDEFRNNVALGASEVFLDKRKIPFSIKNISVRSAKVLKLEIAGVDVMIEKKTKKVYLLEVNRGPGMTYDKISPEFREVAEYFEKHA